MLIFSRDDALVSLLIARGRRGATVIEELSRFEAMLSASRADAVVVDCDDHVRGCDALKAAKASMASRGSPCVAIVNEHTPAADAQDMGAWFVIEKSVLWKMPDAVEHWLQRTRHREHERFLLRRTGTVDSGAVFERCVEVVNISLGGACLQIAGADELEDTLRLRIGGLNVACEVIWCEPNGRIGVRFLQISPKTAADLRALLHT
jgi:hypothetical protein